MYCSLKNSYISSSNVFINYIMITVYQTSCEVYKKNYARFVSISHLRAPLWLNFVLLCLYPLWSCGVFLGEAGGEGSGLAGLSNTLTWFVSADSITAMGFVLDPSTGVKGLRGELLSCRSRGAATTQSCRRLTPPT